MGARTSRWTWGLARRRAAGAVALAALLWSCDGLVGGGAGGGSGGGRGGGTAAGGGGGAGGGAACGCEVGHCLPGGGCGECAEDSHCAAPTPRCAVGEARCVTCLPDALDGCPPLQHCTAARTCAAGCKGGVDCLSGECLPTHECAGCERDAECLPGRVCGSGLCADPCAGAAPCTGGRTCCGGRCVDTSYDVDHCGACDAPCAQPTFCGRGSCHDPLLANLCELPSATALLNGLAVDVASSVHMADALAASCTPAVVRLTHDELDGGLVNPTTGRPRSAGTLLTVGGGSYGHRLVGWIDDGRVGPVYDATVPPTYTLNRRDGTAIVSVDLSTLSEGHDYFVAEVVRAPNGATAVVVAGFFAGGTQAGAWWFINRVLTSRASWSDAWYVVEWTDANSDLTPDAADRWTLIASGR